MKLFFKVLLTIFIIIFTAPLILMCAAVAGSSHHISNTIRSAAMGIGIAAMILGPLGIVAVWLPWKRLIEKRNEKKSGKLN